MQTCWNTAILFSILMIVVIGKLRGIRKKDQKNSFFNLAQFQLQSLHVTVKPLLEKFLLKRWTILRCVKEWTIIWRGTFSICPRKNLSSIKNLVFWILITWRNLFRRLNQSEPPCLLENFESKTFLGGISVGVLVSLKLILRMTELFKVVTWPFTVESTVWYSLELTETKKNSF